MNQLISVDFHFSIKARGRGAKKQLVEGKGEPGESKKTMGRIPRISRYMALAIHFEDLIRQGIVTDYAELARLGHVTRARVTQIMNLRLLAPQIQEELLFLSETADGRHCFQLRHINTIVSDFDWKNQRKRWGILVS